jgi:predicted enzyme related to lactoylglutathione lyase
MADKVIHAEVVGKDGAALQRFYADLFDWNFDTNNPGGYGIAPSSENGIATGVGDATPAGSPGWVTFYVAVSSVDDALAKAEKLGGKVIVPKFSPGPNAVLGMFADPEGHVIGVTEL